jgi:hypothetical protein
VSAVLCVTQGSDDMRLCGKERVLMELLGEWRVLQMAGHLTRGVGVAG